MARTMCAVISAICTPAWHRCHPKFFPPSDSRYTRNHQCARRNVQDESVHGDWSPTPGLRLTTLLWMLPARQAFLRPPETASWANTSGSALSPKQVLYRAPRPSGACSANIRHSCPGRRPGQWQPENMAEQVVSQPDLQPEKGPARSRWAIKRLNLDVAAFTSTYPTSSWTPC